MKLRILVVAALAAQLAACGTMERLKSVGRPPKMTPLADVVSPAQEPSLTHAGPMQRGGALDGIAQADPSAMPPAGSSLFRTGAGALFRDQRATRVGDIVTVRINISDKAAVDNSTSRSRNGSEAGGADSIFGLEKLAKKAIGLDTSKMVSANTKSSNSGSGNTSRSEVINMTVAAVVTAVLPNGNLIIQGRQETRVNFELRELLVSGIVRPQDIARDNSIRHTQIAEARISYGGRGQLTDAQQARWGQQLMDVLSPF